MTQTPEIAVYGGFGSNDYQVDKMCEQISDDTGCEARGISFERALQNSERAADLLHERQTVTHSAGAMAVAMTMARFPEVAPTSLLAVAPPYPVPAWQLIWRARQILENEVRTSRHDREVALANVRQTGALGRELVLHARGNFGEIPAIARFNAFKFGNSLVNRGIATQLAFMDEDEFFSPNAVKFRNYFRNADPRLDVLQIPGYHCEFAQNPRRALGNIATARALTIEETIPDLASRAAYDVTRLAPA